MKALLIVILSLSVTITVFGQEYPDSGFTNKAEAKNLMVNGLKEGKFSISNKINLSGKEGFFTLNFNSH